jgi:formylmethanofuran dehydrogenase subunit E
MNDSKRKTGAFSNRREGTGRSDSWWSRLVLPLLVFALAILVVLQIARTDESTPPASSSSQANSAEGPTSTSGIFTPAHESFFDAAKEFFLWQSTPIQPIAFNHKVHIQHGLQCTSCHTGVAQGPDAGIPSVTFCMACHQVIAADHPEIKKLAAYASKGQEPPWQRVFWFYDSVHVKFWHAPHIRAGVACEQCHGDVSQETVAVKTKDLNMKFCLSCHNAKGVSVDCTTCHY